MPGIVQARLAVGAQDDPLELEAERAAEQVLRSSAAALPSLSAVAGPAARPAPRAVHAALESPSHPLDGATRAFFEPRFGRDLSQVRVHTGAVAAASAAALDAAAYTVGHALFFARDHYDPHSVAGKRLLAHELAHVIQQRSGAPVRVARNGMDPRHARGFAGEQGMGFIHYRREDGWIVFQGPSGAGGHGVTDRKSVV